VSLGVKRLLANIFLVHILSWFWILMVFSFMGLIRDMSLHIVVTLDEEFFFSNKMLSLAQSISIVQHIYTQKKKNMNDTKVIIILTHFLLLNHNSLLYNA
jgi:hypothetical protein